MDEAQRYYVYGLMSHAPEQDDLAGFKGLPGTPGVRAMAVPAFGSHPPLWVICSPFDDVQIARKRRNLLAHTRVLEQVMTLGRVLPVRFGVIADSMEDFARILTANRELIATLFARIDGCVELGIRIGWPREAAMSALAAAQPELLTRHKQIAAGGAAAHFARIDFGRHVAEALDSRRKRAEKALLTALKPFARDYILRAPEDDIEALRAEFLFPSDREGAFLQAVAAAAKASDFAPEAPAEIKAIGPAPAYNFVSLNLDPQISTVGA